MLSKCLSRLFALYAATVAAPLMAQDPVQPVTVVTGGETGVYYAAGQAICSLFNRDLAEHGVHCQALPSSGGVANVRSVLGGQAHFAINQYSHLYKARHQLPPFAGDTDGDQLRVLFALHQEVFTIMARQNAGIRQFDDLKGKRLNIGNRGSGQRDALDEIMQAKGWDYSVFAVASELDAVEQAAALGDRNIDAMVYFVGHPNAALEEASSVIDAQLVAVQGGEIERLLSGSPYYVPAQIPAGLYRGTPQATPSIGVRAVVTTSAQTPADTVYLLVRAVFENLERLRHAHPALAGLEEQGMRLSGEPEPLHEGARRYYQERGWLPAQPGS